MKDSISLLKIVEDTVVDGPGFRISLYAAGCRHFCKNCHNPQSWDIKNGSLQTINEILQTVLNSDSNVTFSGGDPFYQADAFSILAQRIKENSSKTIWCYTGFTFEELLEDQQYLDFLKFIDVLVDGPFVESEKRNGLLFRGSENQRIIDVPKSLEAHQVILFDYNPFPTF